MPTYDYVCHNCGEFEAIRNMGERNQDCACPHCGDAAPRAILHAPRLAVMSSSSRFAMATNERASNAPRSSRDGSRDGVLDGSLGGARGERAGSYGRLKHPSSCSCCATRKSAVADIKNTSPLAAKSFPGRRPWMISH
jgi:putative FmdB family regulatory protein